ncbi:pseudaminic acid synthase [Desulfovibrio sp. X2]|uniref:pseudaminic acid synthase n=1 Tax=Desulfovibrio sp. X2 TaxID=941449 RepID=UPI000358E143|nr:pseudaminic acid synthase [Desulfovibrio sp. X2]EPR37165.1 pseudaminic acid synthase [Desulfovibrio sp. X2]
MSASIELSSVHGPRTIGRGGPCYVIAEMSANHNHDIERAERIVRAAAEAGADAIKLQTYTADTLTIPCDNEYFRIKGTLWEGRTLHDLYQEAYTPWEWQPRLKALANDLGMDCFSTPFDASAVDFLEEMGVPCHKVASFENGDIPLLEKIASTGKPVILSTGMATLADIDEAVRTLRVNGSGGVALLKCTSAYPAPPEEANLRTIPHMAEAFDCPAGLSDHTMGSAVAVAAVALGACIIEKHFTLSRADGGPDSEFSMEPYEFGQMVRDIRSAEVALGRVCYEQTPKQRASAVFKRSLFAVADIKDGEPFTPDNVRSIRPGYGLHPRHLAMVLSRRAAADIAKGTPLTFELLK